MEENKTNAILDIARKYLETGEYEKAVSLLQQAPSDDAEYVALFAECKNAYSGELTTRIKRRISNCKKDEALALIQKYKEYFGQNDMVDILEMSIRSQENVSEPQPVSEPTSAPLLSSISEQKTESTVGDHVLSQNDTTAAPEGRKWYENRGLYIAGFVCALVLLMRVLLQAYTNVRFYKFDSSASFEHIKDWLNVTLCAYLVCWPIAYLASIAGLVKKGQRGFLFVMTAIFAAWHMLSFVVPELGYVTYYDGMFNMGIFILNALMFIMYIVFYFSFHASGRSGAIKTFGILMAISQLIMCINYTYAGSFYVVTSNNPYENELYVKIINFYFAFVQPLILVPAHIIFVSALGRLMGSRRIAKVE